MPTKVFKESALGKIPIEWDIIKFGDFFIMKAGSTPSRSRPDFFQGDIPWVTSGELDYNIIKDTNEKITKEAVQETSLTIIPPGTFILAITGLEAPGTRGRCAILGVPATMNQSCVAFEQNDEYLSEYLFYFYLYHSEHIYFKYAQGSKQQSLPQKILKLIPFHKPPLREQQAIVNLLANWENITTIIEKLIKKKEHLKKGLMQQLLSGKKRFPEFRGEPWIEVKIGDLLKEVEREIEWDDSDIYDLISVKRRSGGIVHRESLYGHEIKTKNLKKVKNDDFIISRMQVVHGASALATKEFEDTLVSGSYHTLVNKAPHKLNIKYFNYLSQTPYLYHLAYISSYGVHIEKMTFNLKDYLKKKIRIPSSLEEQNKIVAILDNIERQINLYESQLEAVKKQKNGLMQKLLTGEVRVNQELTKSGSYG